MALSNEGELYVSSFSNDQVVVMDLMGNTLRTFTGGGLNGPNCVAFDDEGSIYVASAITADVIKFDADENHMFNFTGGSLSSPMGIAVSGAGVLHVAGGGSNNVVRFEPDGTYLSQLSHPDLTGPQGGQDAVVTCDDSVADRRARQTGDHHVDLFGHRRRRLAEGSACLDEGRGGGLVEVPHDEFDAVAQQAPGELGADVSETDESNLHRGNVTLDPAVTRATDPKQRVRTKYLLTPTTQPVETPSRRSS